MRKPLLFLIVLVSISAVIGVGVYIFRFRENSTGAKENTFKNDKYGFSVAYPVSWKIWEYSTPNEPNLEQSYDLIINPSDINPYEGDYPRYFHLRIAKGDISKIKNMLRNDMQEKSISFNGISALEYTYSFENDSDRKYKEIDFAKNGLVFSIYSQFYHIPEVKEIFKTFSLE